MLHMKVTEGDLRRLLAKSDAYLRGGKSPKRSMPERAALAFSRKDKAPELLPNDKAAADYRSRLAAAMATKGGIDRPLHLGNTSDALKSRRHDG